MKKWFLVLVLVAAILEKALSVPTSSVTDATATASNDDDDDDDWDNSSEDDSGEADDDGRVYKNPRNSPNSDCPRDEEQATLLSQKCLRKCSSDEDCKSKKKKCLCDGACGMSCIKPERECAELSKPELGDVNYSSRLFGSRATYVCPHGYHVVGLQSRLCLGDGNWAGAEPACKQNIYCLIPPTIDHARHSALAEQETFDLDSTVQYHCHTGYVTNGFNRAKCLAIEGQASWYGPDISCEPRSCGQPQDPANGYHAGECYTFGCRITHHCAPGYELVGKQERFCQADGSWTPKETPTCVLVTAVQCPTPENPKNGKAIFTSFSYNSVVSYECNYGFTLVGESSRRCGADKKWSGQLPSCKEINCGHPGQLYNGWLEMTESGYGLGASIIFRCQPGMLIVGHASTVCQIDGKWRYVVPQCLAPCVVPTISQGIVVPIEGEFDYNTTTTVPPGSGSQSKVQHGTTLEIVCDEHYEFPLSSLSPPTCNNGTWSIIPRCAPARCKTMPKPPKNGMVLAPKTEHGMKARFRCKDGFNLTAPGGKEITDPNEFVMTCSFGNWTGHIPYCQEVYCSFPGYIPNGKVFLVGNMGLYDYRPYVRKIMNNKQIMYDCDKGYVLDQQGPPGATCIGGLWRPTELPKCLLGQHPRLRWNRRRRNVALTKLQKVHRLKEYLKKLAFNDMHGIENSYGDMDEYRLDPLEFLVDTSERSKRDVRDIEEAYEKYYQKIQSKYRDYVTTLLGARRNGGQMEDTYRNHLDQLRTSSRLDQPQSESDNRHLVNANHQNPRYEPKYSHLFPESLEDTSEPIFSPISIPDITDRLAESSHVHKQQKVVHGYEYLDPLRQTHQQQGNYPEKLKQTYEPVRKQPDIEDLIAQLKSQTVRRRKRDANKWHFDSVQMYQSDDSMDPYNSSKKNKMPKIPCEFLAKEAFLSFEIIREAKIKDEEFGTGTIVKVSCPSDLYLNLQNANSTAKCSRGRWKPMKPACLTEKYKKPCTVPRLDNGKFHGTATDLADDNRFHVAFQDFDTVQSGELLTVFCDTGYLINGHTNIGCFDGGWTVSAMPECVQASCILPDVPLANYMGGYRSGLTIASGSSVTIQCENFPSNSAVNMECRMGELVPSTIHCQLPSRKSREENQSDPTTDMEDSTHADESSTESSHEEERGEIGECSPPSKMDGALVYRNGRPLMDVENFLPDGTEITFNCIASTAGERTTWKIICEKGEWIGRQMNCANTSCIFRNNEPNLVSFYNDQEIKAEVVEFPPGATIVSRCSDIGKFRLDGSHTRTCIFSEWTGERPTCFGMNQENDYAMEKPPTILFRYTNGPIAQSNDGQLIVYPGTTLHMECLWMRRFGTPKWNASTTYRNYPEGWAEEDGRDSTLEYRLSIFHAVPDDSGKYTCITPARYEHTINVVVKEVNCPEIPAKRGLTATSADTKLGSQINFTCTDDNSLIGASQITCLASGNWSAALPVCESVECGDIPLTSYYNNNPHNQQNSHHQGNWTTPQVSVLSREVGGQAVFSCPAGAIRGPVESICQPSGEWSTPFPTCAEVQCESPGAPINGYAQGSPPYRAGDVIQFNCNPEYMMQGQPIIACQDNGRWSGGLPKCTQACSYPGTPISGRMSLVKFYYAIGESISFSCDSGLSLRGAKMLKCLRNGKWSNAIPTCVSSAD